MVLYGLGCAFGMVGEGFGGAVSTSSGPSTLDAAATAPDLDATPLGPADLAATAIEIPYDPKPFVNLSWRWSGTWRWICQGGCRSIASLPLTPMTYSSVWSIAVNRLGKGAPKISEGALRKDT